MRMTVDEIKLDLGLPEGTIDNVVLPILHEVISARANFPPMNSAHEGWAVLFEEVDELWDVVKLNQKKNPDRNEKMRKEAIQVAAMALRFVLDCTSEGGAGYGK